MRHWISISFLLCTLILPIQADPTFLITDGRSSECSGLLFDSGGPDGDYGNNESEAFQICPTEPSQCIQFTLDYYNIEPNGIDRLAFYDAPDINPTQLLASIDGGAFADIQAGGGACFEVAAESGCLTVAFFSDNTVAFEGFSGRWTCLSDNCTAAQPIRISPAPDGEELLAALVAPQTRAQVTDITCPNSSIATFTGNMPNDLGLDRGILLSTGRAITAGGPNQRVNGGTPIDDNGAPGDEDLDQLSVLFGNATRSENACILELDVFATSDELLFEYIFGSEEYPEFVNQEFNDIFAFLISGPGIVGEALLNNQVNIATLPNADRTPVQINSVNAQRNWEYFRATQLGRGSVEFDGLTSGFRGESKTLTARANVIPCETYHLKLAIADRTDADFDSGVFISNLKAAAPELEVNYVSGINTLIETCSATPDQLTIRLPETPVDLTSYSVEVAGTATPGEDYEITIPETITFQPGQREVTFPIRVLGDLETEADETIIVRLIRDFGCGPTVLNEETLILQDQISVEINEGAENVVVCPGSPVELTATGATNFRWQTATEEPLAEGNVLSLNNVEEGFISVIGQVGNCEAIDSIFVSTAGPDIEILNPDTIRICPGDTVQLMQTNTLNSDLVTWSPLEGIINPGDPNPMVAPTEDTEYEVAISLPGCVGTDSVFIDVQFLNLPDLVSDQTICQGTSVALATLISSDISETTYEWIPEVGLDDPTSPTPIATPDVTTTYKVIAQTDLGLCIDSAEVTITVTPAELNIEQGDTLFVCRGEGPVELSATTNDAGATVSWTPDIAFVSANTGLSVNVDPTQTVEYFARTTINGCPLVDSIRVQVDSLPQDLSFTLEEDKDPYCMGEQVIISSPNYEVADFPDIMHMWTEGLGFQTPDSLYNMVINVVDTANYQRITTNGACVDTTEQILNVIEPPMVSVTPEDTTICRGESFDYLVTIEGGGEVMWEPTNGLSCTDCLDPSATPFNTTTYGIMVMTEEGGCDLSISARVNVRTPPVLNFAPNPIICPGEILRLLVSSADPSATYTWTIAGNSDFMSTDPLLEVSPTQATTYNLTAENECGTSTGSITVLVAQAGTLSIDGPTEVCAGDPVVYTAQTNAPQGIEETFTWIVNGNPVSSDQSVTLAFDADATVRLNYRLSDCEVLSETIQVTAFEAPGLQLPDIRTICLGESITLNEDPNDATTYSWSGPDFSSTDAAPTVTPTETSTYTVTASTPNCPVVEESITIQVVDAVVISLPENLLLCLGEELVIDPVLDPEVAGSFEWTWPNNRSTDRLLRDQPTTTTTYTLTFTDEAGCNTVTESVTVDLIETAFFTEITGTGANGEPLMEGDTVFVGQTIELAANINPSAGFTFTFDWTGNGEPTTTTENPIAVIVPEVSGAAGTLNYLVAIETDPGGCDLVANLSLIILPSANEVPGAFTPNGDNTNDVFRVFFSGDIEDFDLKVFNRWGQLVFESTDPNQAWDGTKDGEPQPADVYIYKATFTQNAMPIEKSGEVTLVR